MSAVILHLDDRSARRVLSGADHQNPHRDPEHDPYTVLGRTCLIAAASVSGPRQRPPQSDGPWSAIGMWPDATRVVLRVSMSGTVPAPADWKDQDDPDSWVVQWGSSRMRQACASLRRPTPWDVYGPNQVAGISLASLWWLHTAVLTHTADPIGLGVGVADLLNTHLGVEVNFGQHTAALNKAGSLVGPGPVHIVWSGGRLCRPDDLLVAEKRALPRGC